MEKRTLNKQLTTDNKEYRDKEEKRKNIFKRNSVIIIFSKMKEDIAYITIAANVAAHAFVQGSAPRAIKLLETIEQARVK